MIETPAVEALTIEAPPVEVPVAPEDPAADVEPDRWGIAAETQVSGIALGWLDCQWFVDRFVFPQIFQEVVSQHWFMNAAHNFGIPLGGRWLSLGCGSGNIERQMSTDGLFDSMVAMDPSGGAVDVARRETKGAGITNLTFEVADINAIELPPETYDVVTINMALHHCEALERVAWQINRALRPGGVLVANEFVGPNQFQYPPERVALVNSLLRFIPEAMRWNPIARETKEFYPIYPRTFWNSWDPTESIRSDEIPGVLEANFPALRRYDYKGTLLNLLLENIIHNFDESIPAHVDLLAALVGLEHDVVEAGLFPSDFAFFVCPKGTPASLSRGRRMATLDLRRRATIALRRRALA
jgi:ubiquinone/menaquinone biosynthesis C-methylase UbiE